MQDNILAIYMGDTFYTLSPLLQEAHLGNKKLEGVARVRRGNWIARRICSAFHFPAEGENVHLRVDCFHTNDSMLWIRNFNGLKMKSNFQRQGRYLVEHLGPLALSFKAVANNGQLEYQFVRTRFFGIPVPNFVSPKIVAGEREVNGRYHFSVVVSMFLVGMVISYSGELHVKSLK